MASTVEKRKKGRKTGGQGEENESQSKPSLDFSAGVSSARGCGDLQRAGHCHCGVFSL